MLPPESGGPAIVSRPRYKVNPGRRANRPRPGYSWVAGEGFSSRESNSTDPAQLVKSSNESDETTFADL